MTKTCIFMIKKKKLRHVAMYSLTHQLNMYPLIDNFSLFTLYFATDICLRKQCTGRPHRTTPLETV